MVSTPVKPTGFDISPQVTTVPFALNAVNAFSVLYIAITLSLSVAGTAVTDVGAVPPFNGLPHAITEPSAFNAANACSVEYIATTFVALVVISVGYVNEPPVCAPPHTTTSLGAYLI